MDGGDVVAEGQSFDGLADFLDLLDVEPLPEPGEKKSIRQVRTLKKIHSEKAGLFSPKLGFHLKGK